MPTKAAKQKKGNESTRVLTAFSREAHASRVLVEVPRRNNLSFSNASRKSVIARTRSTARETRALPNPIFVTPQGIKSDATQERTFSFYSCAWDAGHWDRHAFQHECVRPRCPR